MFREQNEASFVRVNNNGDNHIIEPDDEPEDGQNPAPAESFMFNQGV